MSLLSDVQRDATSGSVPLADVLRRCVILAAQLKDEEFSSWVNSEYKGYKEESVPEYRQFRPKNFKGLFSDRSTGNVTTYSMPNTVAASFLSRVGQDVVKIRSGVKSLENLLKSDSDEFYLPWSDPSTDSFAENHPNTVPGKTCYRINSVMYKHDIETILDEARDALIKMIAHIDDKTDDGLTTAGSSITNNFNGPASNVAIGSQNFTQQAAFAPAYTQQNLNVDMAALVQDLARLRQELLKRDLAPENYAPIAEIHSAEIEAAKPEGERDQSKIIGFLAKAGQWALTAATNIGTAVAAQAIEKSMGLVK